MTDRARSRHELHACGDPERWGGASSFSVVAPIAPAAKVQGQSAQLIRTQTRDLIAVGWDLTISWRLQGIASGLGGWEDDVDFTLELTLGTGQSTTVLPSSLLSIVRGGAVFTAPVLNPGAVANGFSPAPAAAGEIAGLTMTAYPIPAVSLALRATIAARTYAVAAHQITALVNAHVAPRGYPV